MINIACVLNVQHNRRGPQYSIDWVDRLYRAVARNLDIPFEFTCLSNVDTPYTTVKLISNSDIYWNKIELFRKDIFQGPVFYLDLDVVICKNITNDIINLPKDRLLMTREPYRDIINSSVMFWDGDYSHLFEQYVANKDSIVEEYSHSINNTYGDQAYIRDNVPYDTLENYTKDNFIAWRHHKIETDIKDPSILIFTSNQKPSNNLDLDLVKLNWI
jgi:hypothetical protein